MEPTLPTEETGGTQPRAFQKKEFFLGVLIGLLVTLCVSLVFLMVYQQRLRRALSASSAGDRGERLLDTQTLETIAWVEGVFDAYSIYEIPEEDLRRGMIDGLIEGSGDRYAQYYSEEELDDLFADYEGVFFGIGAMIFQREDNWPTVSGVYEDCPAASAGVKAGDVIYEVDGESTYGLSLDEVVKRIRGEEGTQVVLTIAREGENDYLTIPIVRGEVTKISVNYRMATDEIGYIQIQTFDDPTADQFAEALAALSADNLKGLVIDLRSNTGGLLSSVVDIGGQILPQGIIVYTEDVNGKRENYYSDGESRLTVPVAVLTDGYTASASEILTGALQDYGMATVIGTTTYGKGVVQRFFTRDDGSGMKLTVEQYFTPNGRMIDGEGIAPDIEIELDYDEYYAEEPRDNQLNAALDYLEEQLHP